MQRIPFRARLTYGTDLLFIPIQIAWRFLESPDSSPSALVGHRIRRLAAVEGETLRAGDHPIVAAGARRHFGGWKPAFETAGCTPPENLTWTKEAVIAAIRDDVAKGLAVNSARIMRRNANLYVAGRRRFGTWAAALIAANNGTAKSRPGAAMPRTKRRSTVPVPAHL